MASCTPLGHRLVFFAFSGYRFVAQFHHHPSRRRIDVHLSTLLSQNIGMQQQISTQLWYFRFKSLDSLVRLIARIVALTTVELSYKQLIVYHRPTVSVFCPIYSSTVITATLLSAHFHGILSIGYSITGTRGPAESNLFPNAIVIHCQLENGLQMTNCIRLHCRLHVHDLLTFWSIIFRLCCSTQLAQF